MATSMGAFTDILLRKGTISPDQLAEAEQMSKGSGQTVADCLIRLGYASGEDVMRAVAEEHHLEYVDLDEIVIPPDVIELVPESVARENAILPMLETENGLKVIVSDPHDFDTLDKLRFILNRKIETALAPKGGLPRMGG